MSFIGLEKLSGFLRWFLEITTVAGILITMFLWWILKHWFWMYFIHDEGYYWACLMLLTPCGLLALVILRQLIAMLKTVNARNPFVEKNVAHFRNIAVCSFLIMLLFIVLVVLYPTVMTFVVAYIFLIAGMAFLILGQLFKRAVAYKQENDLTI